MKKTRNKKHTVIRSCNGNDSVACGTSRNYYKLGKGGAFGDDPNNFDLTDDICHLNVSGSPLKFYFLKTKSYNNIGEISPKKGV